MQAPCSEGRIGKSALRKSALLLVGFEANRFQEKQELLLPEVAPLKVAFTANGCDLFRQNDNDQQKRPCGDDGELRYVEDDA